jgi:hypothetical protein
VLLHAEGVAGSEGWDAIYYKSDPPAHGALEPPVTACNSDAAARTALHATPARPASLITADLAPGVCSGTRCSFVSTFHRSKHHDATAGALAPHRPQQVRCVAAPRHAPPPSDPRPLHAQARGGLEAGPADVDGGGRRQQRWAARDERTRALQEHAAGHARRGACGRVSQGEGWSMCVCVCVCMRWGEVKARAVVRVALLCVCSRVTFLRGCR